MEISSSGLSIAIRAALTVRPSPEPWPIAISAEPASCMMLRTSAKSRLMIPVLMIRSEMPWMPWRSTSSARRKVSRNEVFLSTICSRR